MRPQAVKSTFWCIIGFILWVTALREVCLCSGINRMWNGARRKLFFSSPHSDLNSPCYPFASLTAKLPLPRSCYVIWLFPWVCCVCLCVSLKSFSATMPNVVFSSPWPLYFCLSVPPSLSVLLSISLPSVFSFPELSCRLSVPCAVSLHLIFFFVSLLIPRFIVWDKVTLTKQFV